jgi:hypothetical protein
MKRGYAGPTNKRLWRAGGIDEREKEAELAWSS